MRTMQSLCDACVIFEHFDATDHIDNARFLDRFPCIQSFQFSELLIALTENLACATQDRTALCSGGLRPAGKGLFRCLDSRINCRLIGNLNITDGLPCARMDRLK